MWNKKETKVIISGVILMSVIALIGLIYANFTDNLNFLIFQQFLTQNTVYNLLTS